MNTEDDDDVIPNDTYIPLIDADPKVIARRLGEKSWESPRPVLQQHHYRITHQRHKDRRAIRR